MKSPEGATQTAPARRAVIFGFGMSGAKLHTPLLQAAGIAVVGAVASERRSAAAESAHVPLVSAEAALNLEADIAVIAVPDVAHEEQTLAAINSGFPWIVVEKPVAVSSAAARRMQAAADAAGSVLIPFHNRRLDADYRSLCTALESGPIDDLSRVESSFVTPSGPAGADWRSRPHEGIDGKLAGIGTHLVDQMIHLLGPVSAVYAEIQSLGSKHGPNDDAFLSLKHASGHRSHIRLTRFPDGPRFLATGREWAISVSGQDPQQAQLIQGLTPSHPTWGIDPTLTVTRTENGQTSTEAGQRGDWVAFYQTLARSSPAPVVEMADAIHGLDVMEAALWSSREAKVIRVEAFDQTSMTMSSI